MDALLQSLGQHTASTPGSSQSGTAPGAAPSANGKGFQLSDLINGRGGLMTGLATGGLAGLLIGNKKTRKFAKSAATLGGVALAGGLAYKAYQNWDARKSGDAQPQAAAAAAPSIAAFIPEQPAAQHDRAKILICAMINAAKADGHIDAAETEKIRQQLATFDLQQEDYDFLAAELEKPHDIDAVVRLATSPEIAAEIYTASLFVCDDQKLIDKAYLALLSAHLGLDQTLEEELKATVEGHMEEQTAPDARLREAS